MTETSAPATAEAAATQGLARSPMAWLLLASSIVLLLLISLPGNHPVRVSASWFPTSLHTILESFSIAVSVLVFGVCWHAWRPEQAGNLIVLACGFLAVALLDLAHMLSYEHMPPLVTPASPQKSIVFWLCARTTAAVVMLLVAFRDWRPLRTAQSRHWLMAATLAWVAAVYYLQLFQPHWWPLFFDPGSGLTRSKIATEWSVIALMAVATARLYRVAGSNGQFDSRTLLLAALMWMLSELSLMLYSNVNDVFSLLGHVLKAMAYLGIYRVVFVASVREPYQRLQAALQQRDLAERRAQQLTFYDALTGLPNRALLRDRVEQALAAGTDSGRRSALLLLNVDGFKTLNDSHGHRFGDDVLRCVADRLSGCIGEADTLSRTGGDDFAVLLQNADDLETVALIQQSISEQVSQPMQVLGHEVRSSVSIGIALAPHDGGNFDALMQSADTALHRAKKLGGNTWCFFDSTMNAEAVSRLRLHTGLKQALERGEFVLHYQPQIALADGTCVGVEALLRWQHPEQGLLPPAQFIGEAEATGLIVPIGRWVLGEACRQAAAWQRDGIAIPRVAVNLSAKQFQHGDIEAEVRAALEHSELDAERLELELTESILIQDAVSVLASVRRLRALGVRLSIDDFGTGYSSLAYLRDFPVDMLKIDRSFVCELSQRADGDVIVATIIQLARSLGLQTIAEGVEDHATAEALQRLGCSLAQGFLYARPLAVEQLLAQLPAARLPA